jgi:hypothetical protein
MLADARARVLITHGATRDVIRAVMSEAPWAHLSGPIVVDLEDDGAPLHASLRARLRSQSIRSIPPMSSTLPAQPERRKE